LAVIFIERRNLFLLGLVGVYDINDLGQLGPNFRHGALNTGLSMGRTGFGLRKLRRAALGVCDAITIE
jgi:hypothetical protein